ncbi:MAG: hypothetical protein CMD03_00140 [Flavobacteriales bacterium]|nr:hypothetical protein [Flavobacteriales bacterium]
MRKIILFFLFIFNVNFIFSQNWQLVWSDDFDGNTLDSSKWKHDFGTGSQFGMWGWGNGELQYYQSQNTFVSNGVATIEVKEEPNGLIDSWNNVSYYSSSKISTKGLFDFRYGKVEARIKTIDGTGFWPAFWMLPSDGSWPCDGEIDIMEQWGNDYLTNNTTGAAHIGSCPYSQSTHFYQSFGAYSSNGSFADDFHKYAIIWKEDTISWYVNDVEMFQITPQSYFSIPQPHQWPFNSNDWYIMINLAITQSGPNSNTVFPNNIQIDYVRVYKDISSTSIENKNVSDVLVISKNLLTYNTFKIANIKILDLNGRILLSEKKSGNISLSNLNQGLYIIEALHVEGYKIHQKIIKY